jgi:hypothetical protein
MGARGRPHRFELVQVERVERPRPPAELSADEAAEWAAIVNVHEADHFARDTWPLLTGYVGKTIRLRQIRRLIEAVTSTDPFDVSRYAELCRLETDAIRALAILATKMRLAQQSVEDRRTRKPTTIERPWD